MKAPHTRPSTIARLRALLFALALLLALLLDRPAHQKRKLLA
jgi:hypothetical protein